MAGASAVVFVPDDTARTGLARPLLLQPVMGSPLLAWLASAMTASGIGRFFLVCHERFAAEARACFPESASVTESKDQDAPDLLHVFLSTADELEQSVLVITGPAVMVPGGAVFEEEDGEVLQAPSGCVTSVSRQALMTALDDRFSLLDFLRENGTPCTGADGFFAVTGIEDLADWQGILLRRRLLELMENGVQIWDLDNCYVDPRAVIGRGTQLLPGTIVQGRTHIGENCRIGPASYLEDATVGSDTNVNQSQVYHSTIGNGTQVGPFAYVRPDCTVGDHVRVGDFVELKNSVIGNGTKISHLTYVGDSDVGRNINFGCGTVTVNYDRAKKYRTTIEDDAFIGCNTNLIAPVTVGRGAYIAAGSTITDQVPPQALAIARARQINKRDWAAKNKVKK